MTRRQLIAVTAGVLEAGCRNTQKTTAPTIKFTRIPKADVSGSDKHDVIEGAVVGAREGQKIVLYSKNSSWWLQPLLEAPFTKVLPNAKWRNGTHLGSDYAALLVEPEYRPERNLQTLPAVGGLVAAVSVTKGASVSPSRMLQFSGYEWRVRNAVSSRGGRDNPYSADNAWTDPAGSLHLRIKKKGERLECAEVALTQSLGYGTYSFQVRDVSKLPAHVMLEMFTWDYSGSDQNNREMDVVIRRRSTMPKVSARFVVQPYQVTSNLYEFDLPPGPLSHSFHWEAGRIDFATLSTGTHKRVVAEHTFTLGVPSPGLEAPRIALFLLNGVSQDPLEAEVVIERFDYAP